MAIYEGSGSINLASNTIVTMSRNPARWQSLKFLPGDFCGIPGSNLLHQILRVTVVGRSPIYTVVHPSGSTEKVPEHLCISESELYDRQRNEVINRIATAQEKLERLRNMQ